MKEKNPFKEIELDKSLPEDLKETILQRIKEISAEIEEENDSEKGLHQKSDTSET